MTEQLYYLHPDMYRFDAKVLKIEAGPKECAVVLDRTCFYPEGGGQPADTGTIGGVAVQDVVKKGDTITHRLDSPEERLPFKTGDTVEGAIDKVHRFEYMQQHTGQHVLSAALLKECGLGTVSVHHGEEYVTIEVDREDIDPEAVFLAEDEANRVIRANLPVEIRWVDEDEADSYSLRRPPKKKGRLRLVLIEGCDAAACGGLHTPTTGEVGLVAWTGMEKIRGRQRLYWKIGSRAYLDYREKTRVTGELNTLFSSRLEELPDRAEKFLEDQKELKRHVTSLQNELSGYLAEFLYSRSGQGDEKKVITHRFTGEDAGFIRSVLDALISRTGVVVCLVNISAEGFTWFIGCSEDLEIPFDRVRSQVLPLVEGKGGGRKPLWQGMGKGSEKITLFFEQFTELIR